MQAVSVDIDASCTARFSPVLPVVLTGSFLTATVTDAAGNTSEEIFADCGEGLRSPSAVRDPLATPNLSPQQLRCQEVGLQIQPSTRFRFLADFWTTTLKREILQPVPELPPQNIGRFRREGFDLDGRCYLL